MHREARERRHGIRVNILGDGILDASAAAPHVAADDGLLAELERGFRVLLILEQARDEFRARVAFDNRLAIFADAFELGFGLGVSARVGQQLPRLDVAQGRRHQQVFAGDIDVHRLHRIEVLEILLGDERDGNIEDVELVFLHQVKQQVERSLEDFEFDVVAGLGNSGSGRSLGGWHRRARRRGHNGGYSPATDAKPRYTCSVTHCAGTVKIRDNGEIMTTAMTTNGP